MLHYYFDEHINSAIAKQLQLRGVSVLTAQEAGRAGSGIPDVEQLRFATQLGCILVTQDRDFIALAASEQPHTGVILLQKDMSIGGFVEYLELAANCYEPEEMRDRIEFCDW